jgi:Fe-S-cluster-containing dehydrogenase component
MASSRNGNPEILLNFITPHQKWGIHSTYTDNLLMLTLSRGGPIIWLSEDDAKRAGIVDNDWVELFNINGAIAARAVVSQRVNPGMVMMYHAQEKIVNTPGSEITGMRGGIHNSVTRIVLKPTHMIGGYAQFSYGFNYYGTIGTNRDEFVVVRKMNKVDWLDTPAANDRSTNRRKENRHENPRPNRHGLNLDKCIGCHTCSVTCKNVWTSRPGMEYAWFNNVETKPGIGYPKEWENQDKWNGGWVRKANGSDRAAPGRQVEAADAHLRQPEPAADRRLLRALHLRLRPPAIGAGNEGRADGAAAQPDHRQAHGEDRLGSELGRDPRRRVQQAQQGQELRRHPEGHLRPVREHLHDVPAAPVRALPEPGLRGECPSGSIYKREEDGIVLIDQDKCRGWRMCVSPAARTRRSTTTGRAARPRSASSATRASNPASRRCARKPASAASAISACCCMTPTASEAASVEHDRDLYQAQLDIFLDPNDPKVIEQARIDGIPDAWMESARKSPVYKMAVEWKVALPLHPEYRTLPMVWYVPPLSPITAAPMPATSAATARSRTSSSCASRSSTSPTC